MRIIFAFVFLSLVSCGNQELQYQYMEGQVFGTSFHITYEYPVNKKLDNDIQALFSEFKASLSNYDSTSIISRVNQNDTDVELDPFFITVFSKGQEISALTHGAFDMTVAPLVNAWGFGFRAKDSIYPGLVDSLLNITGYQRIRLQDGRIIKDDTKIMLDVSAIAKGYGVDVVADLLASKGVENYLVEIGGELVSRGLSPRGTSWSVGIDKPVESILERPIEHVIAVENSAMATSGNYRQYYVENGVKYSHTIDPLTGYPVRHSLLSATVLAEDCMTADALATSFMVMGLEKSIEMLTSRSDIEALFIYADSVDGTMKTWSSPGIKVIN